MNENDSSSSVVLKLDTVDSTNYYVMFNRINSGTVESENLVMITKADESDWWSLSYLEAKLGSGESTRLANNFELMVISIDLNANPAYADISVKKLSQWDCYDQSMTVVSQVEIWWGHTAEDGTWACNEWHPDKCNGACTTNFPDDGTCMCIKCGLSKPQDGLAVCSPPVEGICSASSEITVGCYSESSVPNCECDCGNPSSTTQGTCVNGPDVASDPISVKSQLDTCSIGQLNFEMAGDRDGIFIQI
jgi:hypothetical protein